MVRMKKKNKILMGKMKVFRLIKRIGEKTRRIRKANNSSMMKKTRKMVK